MRINQPDKSPPAWRGEREIGKSLTLKPKQVKTNQTQSNLIQPMNPTLPPPRPAPGGPPPRSVLGQPVNFCQRLRRNSSLCSILPYFCFVLPCPRQTQSNPVKAQKEVLTEHTRMKHPTAIPPPKTRFVNTSPDRRPGCHVNPVVNHKSSAEERLPFIPSPGSRPGGCLAPLHRGGVEVLLRRRQYNH